MQSNNFRRRTFLSGALALAGVVALPSVAAHAATTSDPSPTKPTQWDGPTSTNGWPVVAMAPRHSVEGSGASFNSVTGDVAEILGYVARRFNYEAITLRPDQVSGHQTDRTIATEYQSNLLSGTALDLLGRGSPVGSSGTLEPEVVTVIRDIVASCQGVVAWGGDMAVPQEGYFQVDVSPTSIALSDLTRTLRSAGVGDSPGTVDVVDPTRRQRSRQFASKTRRGRRR